MQNRITQKATEQEFAQEENNVLPSDVEPPQAENMSGLESQQNQMERLSAIGLMVAGISHECRNELATLELGLELLERLLSKELEALEVICRMRASEIRLQHLFEDIREFAAPIRLDLGENHLSKIWQGAWEILRPLRGQRDAQIEETRNGSDLMTRVDNFRLEQVFRNLFENSLAACSDPVRIELRCSRVNVNHRWAIQITVRDNGPGLSTEQRQKVFDPFFTSKSNGTGLGMAISKRIVESHGGTIRIGNTRAHGAEFVIILPQDQR